MNPFAIGGVFGIQLLLTLVLTGCTRSHSFVITDVTQADVFRLESRHGEFVSGISLRISGQLDGTAAVLINDGSPQQLTGVVDWKTNRLLEGSNCILHYSPHGVRDGELLVEYFFH